MKKTKRNLRELNEKKTWRAEKIQFFKQKNMYIIFKNLKQ